MNLSPYAELLPPLSDLVRTLRYAEPGGPAGDELPDSAMPAFTAHKALQAAQAGAPDEAAADMADIVRAACATMPGLRVR